MKTTLLIQLDEGKDFLRGEHPDKRTSREWIRVMNERFPDLNWGVSQRELKRRAKALREADKPAKRKRKAKAARKTAKRKRK